MDLKINSNVFTKLCFHFYRRLNTFSYPKTDTNLLPHINFGTAHFHDAKVLQGNLSQLPQRVSKQIIQYNFKVVLGTYICCEDELERWKRE